LRQLNRIEEQEEQQEEEQEQEQEQEEEGQCLTLSPQLVYLMNMLRQCVVCLMYIYLLLTTMRVSLQWTRMEVVY